MTQVVEDVEGDGVLKGNGVVVMDNDMDSGWNILISLPSTMQFMYIYIDRYCYYVVDKWITSARGEMLCTVLLVGRWWFRLGYRFFCKK
jgi:hypothetical protein